MQVIKQITLDEEIRHAMNIAEKQEELAEICVVEQAKDSCLKCAEEHKQLAKWLKALKKAQFEYHEAWLIITHPTPDAKPADKDRAQVILDTFRDSLGAMK